MGHDDPMQYLAGVDMDKLKDVIELAKASHKVKLEDKSSNISLNRSGPSFFEFRVKKLTLIIEKREDQDAIEAYDEPTATKFRDLLGEIGTPYIVNALISALISTITGLMGLN